MISPEDARPLHIHTKKAQITWHTIDQAHHVILVKFYAKPKIMLHNVTSYLNYDKEIFNIKVLAVQASSSGVNSTQAYT